MARGRLGGTRTKVKGAVGSVVYQIRKDSDGGYQQTVMERNRERVNNNTPAQAKARMLMGQIQRMFHILPDVISSGFSTIPKGAQSFWHFAKLNYPLLQDDFDNHFNSYGHFAFKRKFDMNPPAGIWKLTSGVLPEVVPDMVEVVDYLPANISWGFQMESYDATYGQLLERMHMLPGDILHVLFYRVWTNSTRNDIVIGRFRARTDVQLNTLIQDLEEDAFLEYTGELVQHQNFTFTDNMVNFDIGIYDDDPDYSLACIAFLNYRETDSFPLFSSSQFRWYQENWWARVGALRINVVYESWKENES